MRYAILPIFLLATWPVFSQESLSEIKREVKTTQKELAREKELHQAEKKRHQEFVGSQRQKAKSLEDQSVALRSQIDSMKAELLRLDAARQKASASTRYFESRKAKYAETLALQLDSLVPILQADIPFKNQESASLVQETAAQLRKGSMAAEEALGRVMEVLLDRLQMGSTVEVWSGVLAYENRSLAGKFVRYGAVAAIFVTQDGSEAFWLASSENNYTWILASTSENRAMAKEALKVAEGKTAPKLVSMPFWPSEVQ